MKREIPQTSLDARASLDPDKIRDCYKKIVSALEIIKTGTYEDIASALGVEPVIIWKRMSEAHRLGLVHRTGDRKVMKSGRHGFVWVSGPTTESIKKKERVMKGKTVQEFSKSINQVKQSIHTQDQLFS